MPESVRQLLARLQELTTAQGWNGRRFNTGLNYEPADHGEIVELSVADHPNDYVVNAPAALVALQNVTTFEETVAALQSEGVAATLPEPPPEEELARAGGGGGGGQGKGQGKA